MKIYIAGPMTGLPGNNYPAFNRMAASLREFEWLDVLNPAENIAPEDADWSVWMRLSFKQVADADAILLLPGWANSPGAKAELQMARWLKLKVLYGCYPLEEQLDSLRKGWPGFCYPQM